MKRSFATFVLSGLLFLGFGTSMVSAQNPAPVQTFYVPLPEPQMLTGLGQLASGLSGSQQPLNPMTRYVGISVIGSGTIIYYDQMENGYEVDISNPASIYHAVTNPSGTQIWGDGNPGNGAPPGIPSDVLQGGFTIILESSINTTTHPTVASPRFNGGDKIASSKAIAVTSTVWADQSATLMSDAVEVYDTYNWGTNYRTPVGTNIVVPGQSFEYVRASIMAGPGGATVQVDADNNGGFETTVNLSEGQSYYTTNNFTAGGRINANNPVQVDLVTGDVGANYESRWFRLLPTNLWTSSYFTPVSTPQASRGRGDSDETDGSGTTAFLYNPGTNAINVSYTTRGSGGTAVNVQKNGTNQTSAVWSGSERGNVYGPLVSITNTNDFAITNAPEGGWIGIINKEPTNNLATRVSNARNGGAGAVIIVNNANNTNNFTNNIGTPTMPVVGVSSSTGTTLRNTPLGRGWVRVTGNQTTNTIAVPAGGFATQVLTNGYGARFHTTNNQNFYAVSGTDTTGTNSGANRTWDWGYSMVPQTSLTPQALVGLAFGRDPTSATRPNENGSPVWVTTVGNTNSGNADVTVYIDYDADPATGPLTDPNGYKYDTSISLRALESVKVYNPAGSQSGMLLYTLAPNVKIAAAWGQDPLQATAGAPGFDGGTGIPPLPQFTATKKSALYLDVDGDGYISPGDHIEYELTIENISRIPVDDVIVRDTLPASVTYLANTTTFTSHTNSTQPLADNGVGNPFPLSGSGITLPISSLPPGATWKVKYRVQIKSFASLPGGTTSIINSAVVNSLSVNEPVELEEQQPLYGKIGDRVWVDTNGNGIQDGGEPGLNGVTVNLLDSSGNPVLDANLNPRTTTTVTHGGNPGYYQFLGVPEGNYIIEFVTPSGYVFTTQNADSQGLAGGANSDASRTTGRSASFALAAGQESNVVDAGMYQPGVISGTVRRDTTGDNLGDTAQSGVTVTLKDGSGNDIDSDPNTPGVQPTTTTTAANGTYSFTGLPPGNYRVVQTVPGGFTAIGDADGGNFTVIGNVTPINIVSGSNVTGRDFVNRAPGGISGFVRADTTGDGNGDTAQSGVVVTLKDAAGNDIDSDPNTPGVQPTTTTTAANGSYSFLNLPHGNYRVVQTVPGGFAAIADVDGGNLTVIGDVTLISVLPEVTVTNRNFVNRQAGAISGTVRADTTGNGVGDTALPGVTVTLKDSSGNDIDSDPNTPGVQPTTTTTAGNGSYSFNNVAPGDYRVVQTVPAGYIAIGDADGGDFTVIGNVAPINVLPGQTVTGRDFTDQQPGTISGFVRADTTGDGQGDTAQSGVTVTLKDAGGNDIDSDPNTPGVQPTTTTTAGDGSYSFGNLPPGDYRVVQEVPGGFTAIGDVDGGNLTVIGDVTLIGVLPGATIANRNFVNQQPGSISGKVWLDTDEDNVGDADFAGVTLALVDGNGVPVLDGNDDPITTVSGPDGSYSFSNVAHGNYGVQKSNPTGYVSVTDSDGGNPSEILPIAVVPGQNNAGNDFVLRELPGTISGRVMLDTDLDGSGDTPLGGVTLTLVDADGDPVLDGNDDPITTTTAPDGTYSIGGVPSGTYGVKMTPVTGAIGVSDADGGLVDWIGDTTDIILPAGGTSPDNDFLLRTQACPNTWEAWQDAWDLDNETPTGNDDGDIHSNLVEYAFCMDPKSGRGTPYCMSPSLEAVDKVDLVFRRTAEGTLDVTYEIEHAATLGAASTAWTTVAIPPANMVVTRRTDGTDMVRVTDLESITGLASGTGFVRMKVTLRDEDDQVVAVASTDVGGWIQTPLDYEVRSFNDPFLDCPIFTGTVTAVEGQDIVTETSGGGINYNALLTAQPCYAEILTGPFQGHRFDMAGGGVNRFTAVVDNDIFSGTAPFSTVSAPQSGLVGAQFVVRPHRTAGSVFPARAFVPTDDPETASVVQMYAGDRWETLWLYNDGGEQDSEPAWVAVGDSNLVDRSGEVVVPGQGGFIYSRHGAQPGASFMLFGKVRPNDFVRPLRTGLNNVGGGYPLVQTPDGRAMTPSANSFQGDRDFKKADQFLLWRGDSRQNLNAGYDTYFMTAGTATRPLPPNWVMTGDVTLIPQNAVQHFKPDYSILLKRNGAAPGNRMPSPWKP